MRNMLYHFIDGGRVDGTSGRFGEVFDPTTGAVAAYVPLASVQETAAAVKVAARAFLEWRDTPPLQHGSWERPTSSIPSR